MLCVTQPVDALNRCGAWPRRKYACYSLMALATLGVLK